MRFVRSTLALALSAAALPLAAQQSLSTDVEGRSAPGGAGVATLKAGTKVTVIGAKGAESHVTVEAWVDASRLGGARDTFPASVGGKLGLRLRAAHSMKGAILGELHAGAGVSTFGKQGSWMHVKRTLWVPTSALPVVAKAPAVVAAEAPPSPAPVNVPAGAMMTARATALRASPVGRIVGTLPAGAIALPQVRDHGWVRVRVEGWVNERDLSPADSSFGASLSAADLHADPEGTRGKVVRWEVQLLSLQTADPLRRDLARDEPYLLARGPGTENALMYLAVPPSLLGEVKRMAPLTNVIVTARVRRGRSEPLGTPILDLKSITRR